MKNTISIIRDKLDIYSKPYIQFEYIQKILEKFGMNYNITQLCNKEILIPIKRGDWYINNKSKDYINPYIVWSLYMWNEIYTFWGLSAYNLYGLSTQVAEWYTIYNTKISWKKIIWNSKFLFIRQRESFFYGIKNVKSEGYMYSIMTPERAFIQLLKEKKNFNIIPYWINSSKLTKLADKYCSKNIINSVKKICL